MSNAEQIVAALGGKDNIKGIEPCLTRVEAEVADPSLVDDDGLRAAGVYGVIRSGSAVQVVVGPQADTVATDIGALLP